MKFDLKHFKKLHEDHRSAVLQHPAGHQIRIAKTALSPKMNEQLSALPLHAAQGAMAPDPRESQADATSGSSSTRNESPNQPVININIPRDGSLPQGPVLASNPPPPQDISARVYPGSFPQNEIPGQSNAQEPATSAPLNTIPTQGGAGSTSEAPKPYQPSNYNLGMGAEPTQAGPTPPSRFGESNIQQVKSGGEEELRGLEHQYQGEKQRAALNAKTAGTTVQNLQEGLNQAQQQMQFARDEFDKARQAYQDQEIKPNHVFDDMGTLGRIKTAIGLVLGGIGGAITHQENPALKFLNAQIDRDVNAQMANLGKQQNMMSAALHLFGSAKDAADFTKTFQMAIADAEMAKNQAQTQDPILLGRLEQVRGPLQAQINQNLERLQISHNLITGNQGQAGKPGQAGSFGQNASINLPAAVKYLAAGDKEAEKEALREVKEQENINTTNKMAMEAFDEVDRLNNIFDRVGSPHQTQAQINSAWNPMIDRITKEKEGRVTPITVELMESLKPDVRDDENTRAFKRKRLYALIDENRSTPYLKSLGLENYLNKRSGSTPNPHQNQYVIPGYQTAGRR